jgi:hypothetical protein
MSQIDVLSIILDADRALWQLTGTGLRAIQLEQSAFKVLLAQCDFRTKPGGTITGFTMDLPSGECEVRRWP